MLLPVRSGRPSLAEEQAPPTPPASTRRCSVLTTIISKATANKPSPKNILLALFPSYISRHFQDPPPPPHKLFPTSFLDGLRGVAALFVLFFHATWTHLGAVDFGYGLNGGNHSWLQLPFVRLIYAGHAMVCVFFVVGGYVVALKPLRKMREGGWDGLLTTASSCLMRRGLRLYIPAMVASLLSAVTVYLGWWEAARENMATPGVIFFADYHPLRQLTLFAQLVNWWEHTWGLLNVWTYIGSGPNQPYYNHYDPHLWTVPYEFRSSLILVLVLVTLARCRTAVRWLLMLALALFNAAWARWEIVLFLAGAWLAELDMVTGAGRTPVTEEATYAPLATGPEDGTPGAEETTYAPVNTGPEAGGVMPEMEETTYAPLAMGPEDGGGRPGTEEVMLTPLATGSDDGMPGEEKLAAGPEDGDDRPEMEEVMLTPPATGSDDGMPGAEETTYTPLAMGPEDGGGMLGTEQTVYTPLATGSGDGGVGEAPRRGLMLSRVWRAFRLVTGPEGGGGRPGTEEATFALLASGPEDGAGGEAPRRPSMLHRGLRAFGLRREPGDAAGAGEASRWALMLLRGLRASAVAIVFVLGLYLLSCPPLGINKTPGYILIVSLVPASYGDPKRIIHGAGAVATVWAVSNSPALQRPFLTGGAQYLGRIGYSLYIVHGPVLHVVGYVVTPALWRAFGSETALKWTAGFVLGNALTFVVVFWLADLFWRGVDARTVGIGRRFEQLCIGER